MEFRILGPLEVRHQGRNVPLGGCRQHRLLAALLLRPGQFVTTERLVDVLWHDSPPITAKQQIHSAVSTLRNALAAVTSDQVLTTSTAGYRIEPSNATIDATEFEERVAAAQAHAARGDATAAVASYRSALALWRGPALTGMTGPVFEPHVTRLNDARLTAIEECLQWELALGRYDQVVAESRHLLVQHPYRQRLVSHLMVGLSRTGQAAAALAAYSELQERLAALGLTPGPTLRKLQRTILRGDLSPAPCGGLSTPRSPWPDSAPHRTGPPSGIDDTPPHQWRKQLATLDRTLLAGERRLVTVTGPARSGKTALVRYWTDRVRHCFPDGQLYVDMGGGASVLPRSSGEALRLLLRHLGVQAPHPTADLDEMAAWYRSLLADRTALVVIDNAVSLEQVLPLLPGGRGCFTVVTSSADMRRLTALYDAVAVSVFEPVPAVAMAGRERE